MCVCVCAGVVVLCCCVAVLRWVVFGRVGWWAGSFGGGKKGGAAPKRKQKGKKGHTQEFDATPSGPIVFGGTIFGQLFLNILFFIYSQRDLNRAPCVLYGVEYIVKYIGAEPLALLCDKKKKSI